MNSSISAVLLALSMLTGCSNSYRMIWHDQVLPSGKEIKVTSFHMVWGVEHDERRPGDDSFALEYVSNHGEADASTREREALEVFELVRPVSELWRFDKAALTGFPTTERKGAYDLYWFKRSADGKWSYEHTRRKVFAND